MPAHKYLRRKPSQKAKARLKPYVVAYASAVIHRGEVVLMLEVPEGAGDHHIAKVAMGPQLFYSAGVPPPHTKMARPEGHRLALADQSGGYAADRPLSCRTSRRKMEINTQREEKAPLDRCIYPGC